MQTFLPYPDFAESARCLDYRRLGKQRVECLQLLNALLVPGKGWSNHSCARMWRGYEPALAAYGYVMVDEWLRRGYRNTMDFVQIARDRGIEPDTEFMPHWLGVAAFHASHRSNLLRKDPVHYGQFGWAEPDDLPYVWP